MIRDEFNALMEIRYGTLDVQAVKPIVLYINGRYWGVYYIREKIDDNFIANNYNVQSKTNIVNYKFTKEEGSNAQFIKLRNYIQQNGIKSDESYNYVSSLLDLENFADYWIHQFVINSTDLHNLRYYTNSKVNGGRIRAILYDTDYSMYYDYGAYYLSFIKNPSVLKAPPDTTYLNALLSNGKFRKLFLSRLSYFLNNVWTQEHVEEVYNYLYNSIKPEMQRNCSRWNYSCDKWTKSIEKLHKYILGRAKKVKQAAKSYFHLTQEEYNEYFG